MQQVLAVSSPPELPFLSFLVHPYTNQCFDTVLSFCIQKFLLVNLFPSLLIATILKNRWIQYTHTITTKSGFILLKASILELLL